MVQDLLEELSKNDDYLVLKRVPTEMESRSTKGERLFTAAIVDLETMGLEARTDEIIELGVLRFQFNASHEIVQVIDSYNELQDPGRPIPEDVKRITGISDEDVKGKSIDWNLMTERLSETDLIICHNSGFDRNFLELQTPTSLQSLIKTKCFACSMKDVDWSGRGFESRKLDYLNFKMGYFYDGHRALVDCWATLNLFLVDKEAFKELLISVKRKDILLCAKNAPFEKKDLLKSRKYRWSDGSSGLPKSWWTTLPSSELDDELQWLDNHVFGREGVSKYLPQMEITARKRYSFRATEVS